MNKEEYIQFMYSPISHSLVFQKIVYISIKIIFVAQVIFYVFKNFYLIKNYKKYAQDYYSDIQILSTSKLETLNWAVMLIGLISIGVGILGRPFFENNLLRLGVASCLFSTPLFIIGLFGNIQHIVNPDFEQKKYSHAQETKSDETKNDETKIDEQSYENDDKIHKLLTELLETQKIYLNKQLTIKNLALAIGTNRSYLSAYINKTHKKNFCKYINDYRIKEAEKIIQKNPHTTNIELAESSGFGSIDSMKRAISISIGKTLIQWKESIIAEKN